MLLDVVAELHHLDDSLAFPPRLLARLRRLIPSDEVGYGDVDPSAQRSRVHVWNHVDGDEGVAAGDEWWESPGNRERWWRVRNTNPICAYWLSSDDWTTPCKVSDFATLRQFRRTPIYDEFIRGLADYLLAVALPTEPTRQRCFTFARLGRDFDERDRLVLRLLQPHLAARAEAVAAAADAAEALAAVENGGGRDGDLVVLCSSGGVIEHASPASRALLARYLGVEDGALPAGLLARREFFATRDGARLHLRVTRAAGVHVVFLDERDIRVEKLTAREREILGHVARGLQNDAIALDLGIAPATVAKHLERVYRKLGVPNRTAAAALVDWRHEASA
jgi:DNA-binding CsgD family transcriptional regulator